MDSAVVGVVDDPLADLLHVHHLPPVLLGLHPRYLVHVLPAIGVANSCCVCIDRTLYMQATAFSQLRLLIERMNYFTIFLSKYRVTHQFVTYLPLSSVLA